MWCHSVTADDIEFPGLWDKLFELANMESSVFEEVSVDVDHTEPLGQDVPSKRIFFF